MGVDGLARNRVEVVPGRAMQAIVAAGRITPQEVRGPLFGRFFR
ncbi:MAG TPA: hypothetical protein VGW10_14700 [Solirubrobacteraceae bacterium]|nr:hypothetical protein [Solirubrobacteraceae bacterium]